jgi:GWxTD domain-containing protein
LKKTFLITFALVFSLQVFPQPSKKIQYFNYVLLSSIYVIPGSNTGTRDSLENLYYLYKIPYNRLVFEKDDDNYTASYRLMVEVHDSISKTITRKIKEDNISVSDFDKTDDGNIYTQGLLSFQISRNGKYNILPVLFDKNSGREIRLNKIPLIPNKKEHGQNKFLVPVVVDSKTVKKDFIISNFEGNIPFSVKKYDLLIPCSDTSLSKIFVVLINNKKDTVFSGNIYNSFKINNAFEEKGGEIVLNGTGSQIFKNFIIPFINEKLMEGIVSINVYESKESKSSTDFEKEVRWYNKPFSLFNPETAIKLLKYMENDSIVDSLLDFKEKDYPLILTRFWKKYDPTPETSFNELMNEYYSRIDYAVKSFSSISGKRGNDTDRGKIFIIYGKPSELERTSNQFGQIVETWIYKNPIRKFIFVDKTGTGEYQLING